MQKSNKIYTIHYISWSGFRFPSPKLKDTRIRSPNFGTSPHSAMQGSFREASQELKDEVEKLIDERNDVDRTRQDNITHIPYLPCNEYTTFGIPSLLNYQGAKAFFGYASERYLYFGPASAGLAEVRRKGDTQDKIF